MPSRPAARGSTKARTFWHLDRLASASRTYPLLWVERWSRKARTTDLVQRLQAARRDLLLESLMDKLDKYDLLILDDISYVRKDQAETSVLFELISARYERRSLFWARVMTSSGFFPIDEMLRRMFSSVPMITSSVQ